MEMQSNAKSSSGHTANSNNNNNKYDELFYKPASSIMVVWCQFFVGIAIYVLSYYLIDNAFSIWSADTVTSENVTKFFIGLLLLSLGWLLWQSAIFRLASSTTYHYAVNIIFLLLLCIAVFVISGIYFVKWGIADWLQWNQTFDGTTLVQLMQGVYLVLTMWIVGVTVFHILIRAILYRSLHSAEARTDSVNKPIVSAEQQPLINEYDATIEQMVTTKRDNEFEEARAKLFEYICVFLFFFVFLPIFIWINCVNVSDWHRMTPSLIIAKMESTTILSVDSWNTYFAFSCGTYTELGTFEETTCYARLFYDILYWYLFIFVIAMFAYCVNKSPSLRIKLRKRIYCGIRTRIGSLVSVTVGECIFWLLWLTMMFCISWYWLRVHLFDEKSKSEMEKWARFVGILAIQFLSMSLFCSTRIRLWNDCFMLSWEALNTYHRAFGVVFVFLSYLHLLLWLLAFPALASSDGTCFPFVIPCTYHTDNFTVSFMFYLLIFFVPVVYIGGTVWILRRKYFEIFYHLHLFGALTMISSVLWHSSQSWRYIVPPLALYAIDRMIRCVNSSRLCKVDALQVSIDGNDNENHIECTKLSFSVASYSWKHGEAAYTKLDFQMGQYAFLHISNLSLYEWHPFTIASGEYDAECYCQIQNEGIKLSENPFSSTEDALSSNAQFTNLLYALASSSQSTNLNEIELHVDGPYGAPFVYSGYDRIVLVGGGIGITPCHSIFSTMLARSIAYSGKDEQGNKLPSVDLIWVAKDKQMFSLFVETWKRFEQHSSESHQFSLRLFATRNGNAEEQKADSEFNHVVPHTQATMYTYGRPDWRNVLKIIKDESNEPSKTLVFACGPPKMVDDVEQVSVKYGARFQAESFTF